MRKTDLIKWLGNIKERYDDTCPHEAFDIAVIDEALTYIDKQVDIIWHEGKPPTDSPGFYLVSSRDGWLKLVSVNGHGEIDHLSQHRYNEITDYAKVT